MVLSYLLGYLPHLNSGNIVLVEIEMADEVKIMQIDDSVVRRVDWARESTLARLADLADEQNKYLAKMANETRRQTGTAARATKAAADAAFCDASASSPTSAAEIFATLAQESSAALSLSILSSRP